jgi:MFS family permease
MKTILRAILAIVAGMVLAFALVIAVEGFSSIVHPVPPNFTGTMDEICQHVAKYPDWVLGVVVIAYSATTFLGTWIATKIGRRAAGAVVSLLLLLAIAFNITKLPYATWFKVVMPVCFLVACYLGVTLCGRAKSKMSFDIAK